MSPPIYLRGVGLWSPGFDGPAGWLAGEPVGAVDRPSLGILPSRQRRATSLTTRMAVEVIGQAIEAGGVDRATVKMVYGSAYGEFQTAVAQLEMMESEDGRLSPARFTNSVHNTPVGLLSIALGNRAFSTALAAGRQTVAMSLYEGMSVLAAEGGDLVVAVADEWPGASFLQVSSFRALAVAFCLSTEEGPAEAATLGPVGRREPGAVVAAPLSRNDLRGNPAAAALPLLEAYLERRGGTIPLGIEAKSVHAVELGFQPPGDGL